MENILNQELLRENNNLSDSIKELKKDNDRLKKALNDVALPALKEYELYESGPIRLIAARAKEMILELLKR